MPASSMQVLKQCRGAKSPQRKTPNVAGERLWFAVDSMANVARDRGDGDGEERQSEVDRQRRSRWPSEVHRQFCSLCKCTLDQQFFTPDDFRDLTTKMHADSDNLRNPLDTAALPALLSARHFPERAIPFILASFPRNARWHG